MVATIFEKTLEKRSDDSSYSTSLHAKFLGSQFQVCHW